MLSLPLRNEDKLDALIADLYNPASPSFHQYITPQEFDIRFGPTADDYSKLLNWAKANGLSVNYTVANNRLVQVEAPVDTINKVFHVTMTTYHDNVRNRDFYAPDREPTTSLPIALLAIDGLDNSIPKHNHLKPPPAALPEYISVDATHISGPVNVNQVPGTVKPQITGSGPGNTYLPSDMRAAYYGTGNLTGTGQTLGVFSYDGYLSSDVTLFLSKTSTTNAVPISNVLVGGYAGNCYSSSNGTSGTCDDGEQILDIVNIAAMAPGASSLLFYESTSSTTELNKMASDNLAKVITSSWGGGDFGTASDTYFKQFATQGQTFFNATGDSGAFTASTYDPPSLDPYIIQVGGTDLTTSSAGGPWSAETAWVDSGGGFLSTAGYTIPAWQSTSGVITAANYGSATYRNSPDIAAEANFDNTTVSNGSFLSGYGGTSYATPRVAGYFALANQQSVANGKGTVGFVDPTLYTLGLGSSKATVYHDITSGNNGSATKWPAVAGYDDVTGWGSPNGAGLINGVAGNPVPDYSIAATTSSLDITRGGSVAGGNISKVTNTISVTAYNSFASTVTFSASGLPTGVTASFTTGTPSSPSTMTISADGTTAIAGTYTVTVTGVSGSLSHSTTFVLNVLKRANGDFTLSATSPTILQNSTGYSTVTVTAGSGLSGGVSLAVSGVPTGVTATFSPTATPNATGSGTSQLTLVVAQTTATGSYTLKITGTALNGLTRYTTFTLTVTSPPSLIVNGGFETETGTGQTLAATGWSYTSTGGYDVFCDSSCGGISNTGTYYAYLNGYGKTDTDTMTQTGITIPSTATKATLSYYVYVSTAETTTTAKNDTLTIALTPSGGTATTVATLSNLNGGTGYVLYNVDVSAFIGKTVTLTFTGVENNSKATSFLVDDVSLVTQ